VIDYVILITVAGLFMSLVGATLITIADACERIADVIAPKKKTAAKEPSPNG
jgi:hypothetical protein